MKWKLESREKKRRGWREGYTCVVEKNREKRKRKIKKRKCMAGLKETKEKYNLEMLSQYFHNKF